MYWYGIRDGDHRARGMLNRHYSARRYRDGRKPKKSVGPGEYMLLMTQDSRAVFGWVRNTVPRRDGQHGVYNCLFRREGGPLASELIEEACHLAWARWPGERLFTYIDADAVQSPNPGYCYKVAGFTVVGTSASGKILLERLP